MKKHLIPLIPIERTAKTHQTGRMPRLIRVFAGPPGHFVGFVLLQLKYRNDPKFSDKYAWANSADPDQTAPRGKQCLPFRLHRLDSLLYGRAT